MLSTPKLSNNEVLDKNGNVIAFILTLFILKIEWQPGKIHKLL